LYNKRTLGIDKRAPIMLANWLAALVISASNNDIYLQNARQTSRQLYMFRNRSNLTDLKKFNLIKQKKD